MPELTLVETPTQGPLARLVDVARCLEVEVTSQGASVEEALGNVREALELYFEDVPLPAGMKPSIVATVEVQVPLLA